MVCANSPRRIIARCLRRWSALVRYPQIFFRETPSALWPQPLATLLFFLRRLRNPSGYRPYPIWVKTAMLVQ
jgi:hypothetical protein